MAKPRTPNQKKRYAALNKRLAKYLQLIQSVYDETAASAASLALDTAYAPESGRPFRFSDYPKIRKKVNDLQSFFARDLHGIVMSATSEEWKQSNLVQDLLVKDVLKAYGIKRGGKKEKMYYQTNSDALKAFQQRKDGRFTISQKLWNQSENMKRELEYCISSAIEKGTSAVTLSKKISKYLHDFPQLQKDYKAKFGRAVDCHNCEYRSIRLARSEINMAYRAAEQERWKQMDFIKGYEIKLSGAHPKEDICDDLAGIYPKSFKWLGWHPNCMCYCIPVIMTDDEYYSSTREEITKMPDKFTEWIENNSERMQNWQSLPYFVTDNENIVENENVLYKVHQEQCVNYKTDRNYEDVAFDKNSGGLKATHINHNSYTGPQTFFGEEKLTGADLERECQEILYKSGHSCILRPEKAISADGKTLTSLDAIIDGDIMDIKSITSNAKHFSGAVSKKEVQVIKFNAISKEKSDSLCLYFHDPTFFTEDKLKIGIERAKVYFGKNKLELKKILCVFKDGKTQTYKIE